MLAFPDAADAIEWAVVLQLALLRVQWSQEVLQTQVKAGWTGKAAVLAPLKQHASLALCFSSPHLLTIDY